MEYEVIKASNQQEATLTVIVDTPNLGIEDFKEFVAKTAQLSSYKTVYEGGFGYSLNRTIEVFNKNGKTVFIFLYKKSGVDLNGIVYGSQVPEVIKNDFDQTLSHYLSILKIFIS
jgi:hypothetical protein